MLLSVRITAQGKRKTVSTSKTIKRIAIMKKCILKWPLLASPIGSMPHSHGVSFSLYGFRGWKMKLMKRAPNAITEANPIIIRTGRYDKSMAALLLIL